MLHWKNRPIDTLSPEELRLALSQTIGLLLNESAVDHNRNILNAFVTGVFCGVATAGIVVTIALVI